MQSYVLTKRINSILGRVMERAEELEAPVALSVVDGGGHPLAFLRHAGTKLIACTTAVGKARCAVLFSRDSSLTEEVAKGNPMAFQSFATASELAFVVGGGGYYIEERGIRLGAGVAGANARLDELVGEVLREELAALLSGSEAP